MTLTDKQLALLREHARGIHTQHVLGCPACRKFPPEGVLGTNTKDTLDA